jgi:hypothetical protein
VRIGDWPDLIELLAAISPIIVAECVRQAPYGAYLTIGNAVGTKRP